MDSQRSLLRGRLADAIRDVSAVTGDLVPAGAPAHASRAAGSPLRPVAGQSMPSCAPLPPVRTSRPWSVAVATEPLGTPPSERRTVPLREVAPAPVVAVARASARSRRRVFAVAAAGALIAAAVALTVSRLMPKAAPAEHTVPITLTGVRPVAAPVWAGVSPPTQLWFPAGTATVYLDLRPGVRSMTGPVGVTVAAGQPQVVVINRLYVLNAAGDTVIALAAPSTSFAAGQFVVTISFDGARLGTAVFTVG